MKIKLLTNCWCLQLKIALSEYYQGPFCYFLILAAHSLVDYYNLILNELVNFYLN